MTFSEPQKNPSKIKVEKVEVRELTPEEEKTVELKMQAAFLKAVNVHPYLAMALYSMVRIRKDGLGTFATDQYWRFYYDPVKVLEWSVAEISGVILHEVRHCLHGHAERWKEMKEPQHLAMIHNYAADSLINTSLVGEDVTLPENCVTVKVLQDQGFKVDENMTSERIYHILLETLREQGKGKCNCDNGEEGDGGEGGGTCPEHGLGGDWQEGVGSGECGSITDGVRRSYEDPNSGEAEGLSRERAENIKNKTAVEIKKHSKSIGNVSADLARWAEEHLNPVIDWRKELASILRRKTATLAGLKDYTYSRPSRRISAVRNMGNNIILPAMRKPEPPSVAIVVDTSGSMSDEMLSWALGEIKGVLDFTRSSQKRPVVIACDTAVGAAKKVNKVSDIELVGGGGTDMGAGIEAAVNLKGQQKPEIVIVITDGYTPWPNASPRGVEVIVALTTTECEQPPSWARTVVVAR